MEALVIIIINLTINVFIKNSASLEFPLQLTLQIFLDGGRIHSILIRGST